MGWTGSDDTKDQIRLRFKTKEKEIADAERAFAATLRCMRKCPEGGVINQLLGNSLLPRRPSNSATYRKPTKLRATEAGDEDLPRRGQNAVPSC